MNRLPRSFGTLGGIVGFCAAQLLCVLRGSPPLASMKRAAACALALAALTWLCTHIAVSVLREAQRNPEKGP